MSVKPRRKVGVNKKCPRRAEAQQGQNLFQKIPPKFESADEEH